MMVAYTVVHPRDATEWELHSGLVVYIRTVVMQPNEPPSHVLSPFFLRVVTQYPAVNPQRSLSNGGSDSISLDIESPGLVWPLIPEPMDVSNTPPAVHNNQHVNLDYRQRS
jgi:hypothetical protein